MPRRCETRPSCASGSGPLIQVGAAVCRLQPTSQPQPRMSHHTSIQARAHHARRIDAAPASIWRMIRCVLESDPGSRFQWYSHRSAAATVDRDMVGFGIVRTVRLSGQGGRTLVSSGVTVEKTEAVSLPPSSGRGLDQRGGGVVGIGIGGIGNDLSGMTDSIQLRTTCDLRATNASRINRAEGLWASASAESEMIFLA